MATDDVAAMARLSLFGALKPETISFLLARCEAVSVSAGDSFFVQGESGDALFVLRSGRVAVVRALHGESLVLAEFGPGACFGEMALVGISPRSATVQALEPSSALRLPHLSLLELYEHDLEQFTLVQMNLGREVARRLEIADEALFEHARRAGRTTMPDPVLERAATMLK